MPRCLGFKPSSRAREKIHKEEKMSRDSDFQVTGNGTSFAKAPGPVEISDTDLTIDGVPYTFPPGEDAAFLTSPITMSRFDDSYFGHHHEVSGNAGNDVILIDEFDGIARGDAGNDTITSGQNGGVTAFGGQGDDSLHAFTMTGGSGADDFHLDYWFNDLADFSNAGAEVRDFNPHQGDHLFFSGDGNTDPVFTHDGDLWTVTSVDQAYRDFTGDPNALFSATFHLDGVTHLDATDYTFDVPVTVEGDILV
jgi:hypothetical protein